MALELSGSANLILEYGFEAFWSINCGRVEVAPLETVGFSCLMQRFLIYFTPSSPERKLEGFLS